MARISRPPFRRKTGLRISKGEAALEHAFKEQDVEIVGDVTSLTLTRVPDLISVAVLTADVTIDIVVPTSDPQAFNRVVRVSNRDVAQQINLTVNGGTATVIGDTAAETVDVYIADASANTAPLKL